MVSPAGFTAAASCAAIRAGISAVQETGFRLGGAPLLGASIPFEDYVRGREKLLRMAVLALEEGLHPIRNEVPPDLPVLLCLPETDRPGRLGRLDASFMNDLRRGAGLADDARNASLLIPSGRVAAAVALRRARELMARGIDTCAVVGVDTFLTAGTVAHFGRAGRLLTASNSNGFIPGEAAAAVLLASPRRLRHGLSVLGVGAGQEPATLDSEQPLRGDGMLVAVKGALAEAASGYEHVDYRIADASGEQYRFKELTGAPGRSSTTITRSKRASPRIRPSGPTVPASAHQLALCPR
jgi:3-oxoacyl-[acyl-carrier-protein] synthase-1